MVPTKEVGAGHSHRFSLLQAYLGHGPSYRVQENEQRHQDPSQDAVLDLPEGQQECHAERQQVQP